MEQTIVPEPPAPYGNYWSINCEILTGFSVIPLHSAIPTEVIPDIYQEQGIDNNGWPYKFEVQHDPVNHTWFYRYLVDEGFGDIDFAYMDHFVWDGVAPVVLGPNAWTSNFGTVSGDITAYFPWTAP